MSQNTRDGWCGMASPQCAIILAMQFFSRTLVHLILGAALLCAGRSALAADSAPEALCPGKLVHFINPFPAGGPADIVARSAAESFPRLLGKTVVVESKPGAGGNLGAEFVSRSAPDGCTLMVGIDSTLTINPTLYKNYPIKVNDLKPVMLLVSSGMLMGVHPDRGIRTLDQLIARARTEALTFSNGSNGSPGHLASEMFIEVAKVKLVEVPYKGNTAAVSAVVAGEVDGGILATPGMLPFVASGKVIALAVTSNRRSALAPQVPSTAELGLPGLQLETLYVAMVPAATPPAAVALLARAITDALGQPEIKARLERLDLLVEAQPDSVATQRLAQMRERFAAIIRTSGMTAD